MCARVVRVGETSATTSNRTRRATPSEYARPSWPSRRSIGDLADHADAHAQRVAGSTRVAGLDLHRRSVARAAPAVTAHPRRSCAPARSPLARQRLKDLVDLALTWAMAAPTALPRPGVDATTDDTPANRSGTRNAPRHDDQRHVAGSVFTRSRLPRASRGSSRAPVHLRGRQVGTAAIAESTVPRQRRRRSR